MIQPLSAGSLSTGPQESPRNVAFARYIASLERRNPFAESRQFVVLIEAAAPDLYKESALLAIRQTGNNERSEYLIVGVGGDGAVTEEVTARYFAFEEQMENLARSSTLVSLENYKFKFRGEVKTGKGSAYVYDITPRKRRAGLFQGQIWIDAVTGAELLVSGHRTDANSISRSITFVREITLEASGYTRVTHLTLVVPLLGRSEVVVTERPLASTLEVPTLQGAPRSGASRFNPPNSRGALGPRTPVY